MIVEVAARIASGHNHKAKYMQHKMKGGLPIKRFGITRLPAYLLQYHVTHCCAYTSQQTAVIVPSDVT